MRYFNSANGYKSDIKGFNLRYLSSDFSII